MKNKNFISDFQRNYHNEYLELYKKNFETMKKTIHPEIKNLCLTELNNIRGIWKDLNFDLKELDSIDKENENMLDFYNINNFKRVYLSDLNMLYYSQDVSPYLTALAYCEKNEEDSYFHLCILHVEESYPGNKTFGGIPQFGDYVNVTDMEINIKNISEEEVELCKNLYQEFIKLHEETPYTITGYKYSANDVELEKKVFNNPNIPKSLDDAEKWLLQNHPDYYFGASIVQQCPSGNFLMLPVPSYYEQQYHTNNRQFILEQIAKEKGIVINFKETKQEYLEDIEL